MFSEWDEILMTKKDGTFQVTKEVGSMDAEIFHVNLLTEMRLDRTDWHKYMRTRFEYSDVQLFVGILLTFNVTQARHFQPDIMRSGSHVGHKASAGSLTKRNVN
jgi:hypothetical protein